MNNKLGKPVSQRQLRVGEMIKQSLGMIFARNEAKVPELETNTITVTEVKMSQDLKVAKAYVLPLGGKNAEEAVEKLQLLIENKDLRLKLGKNAKKHAFEKFNWSSILKTYSNLKDDLKSIKAKESGKYLDVLNKISSDRLPPYKIFKSYPSRDLNMTSSIKKMLNVNSFDFKDLYDNSESIWYAKTVLPELSEINLVLESLSKDKYESIKSLSEKLNIPSELAIRIVALLSKYGYINVKE